jgi:hypothetical protein
MNRLRYIAVSEFHLLAVSKETRRAMATQANRAVRLARPAHQSLPGPFMLGYTGLNCQQPAIQTEVDVMQSSNVCTSFQAKATQPTLPACTSLTVGSTRTKMLRIFAG